MRYRKTAATLSRTAAGIVAVLIAALCIAILPATAPPASAANAADWDPGYIIDDAIFYDSNAMTAPDIQTFLNGQVRACRSGYTCLKDYAQSTDNRPADAFCNGYSASARQSAAEIIDNVARSCGISQRVLLVLLQKEQGLVTDTAPSAWSFSAAMGQGCPDTAPCDPATQGFFYQVYYAARQFEVYRAYPNSFGYRAQRWNNILYNPNTACGTQSVFINNQATAALYIYTPYTPNAAALANMYGTGDSCSAYGNRNFWRLFTDWFGDTRSYAPHPGFVDYWNARGGASGTMGPPTGYPVFVDANGQGWYQRFRAGVVYGSNYGGTAFVFDNVILAEYNRQGGPASGMGWPTGEQICSTGLRCSQSFLYATISSTAAYGAHTLWGGLNDYWKAGGGTDGRLGAALNDAVYSTAGAQPAWVQNFERGVVAQNPAGTFLVPYGDVMSVWLRAGGGEGWLGWPASEYSCVAGGCAQRFAGGTITWNSTYGAHVISGGFIAEWTRRGGFGALGPALTDLVTVPAGANGGGWVQNFGGGVLAQSGAGIFLVPYGPAQALWSASGGQSGTWGWPYSDRTCVASGCGQSFQYGGISDSTTWGVHTIYGGLGQAWKAAGGMSGYGAALNDIRYATSNGGGYIQHYSSGVVTQQRDAAPVFTPYGRILDVWFYYGAEATWLGWPKGTQTCSSTGCVQQFQNGVARSDAAGSVSFLPR
ncbi:LGFP repeat-containing protein [Microbacterium rhizomatis]|uniref:LGFP repeat-containing protein n=1 Tax=Microbacterium rhizomatis TaxID=1631477 RepID=A0A5J5J8X4_9MICO|nr:hypothetical protein [Microbacterium rhizomatis]KAA9111243.1 hypothetical protein F6B43_06520 [Microbacterium rhizomatis]